MTDCDGLGGHASDLVQPPADGDHDNPKKEEHREVEEEVLRDSFS